MNLRYGVTRLGKRVIKSVAGMMAAGTSVALFNHFSGGRSTMHIPTFDPKLNTTTQTVFDGFKADWSQAPQKPLSDLSPDEYRAGGEALFIPNASESVAVKQTTLTLKARDGESLSAFVLNPEAAENGCVIYYPGGAFVSRLGDIQLAPLSRLAKKANCMVVMPLCRLAPEYKLPTGSNDAFDVYRWVYANADALGIDPEKIALAGDSHGGNFALMTALQARQAGLPVKFVLPISPATDLLRMNPEAFAAKHTQWSNYAAHELEDILVSQELATHVYRWALPDEAKGDEAVYSPLSWSLKGLPPVITLVPGNDGLLRDSLAFMSKLAAEDDAVAVTAEPEKVTDLLDTRAKHILCFYPGQAHSFMIMRQLLSEGPDPVDAMIATVQAQFAIAPEAKATLGQ